jgi:plasmid stabilization system protein ParE
MRFDVKVHAIAKQDVRRAFRRYEERRVCLGEAFLECVESGLERISRMAASFANAYRDLKRVSVRRFPYGIFYRLDGRDVLVVGILHNRQDVSVLDESNSGD